jgi:FKBP-type peptidyl-prolyl cis-trans isomerase
MRKSIVMMLAVMVLFTSASLAEKKAKPADKTGATAAKVELKTKMDTLSYAFGAQFGSDFMQNDININPDFFYAGLKDALAKGNKNLTDEQIQKAILDFNQEMRTKQLEKQNETGKANKEAAEKFFAENSKKPEVKTTASGLQYTITKEGTGKAPTATDVVKVHYTGKLLDGTIFDSSIQRGEPIEFPLNGVIPGWTEGLQLMKEGGEAMLYIPSNLGYGDRGAGGVIGPNAALIFEVKLLEVKPASAATPNK